MTVALNLPPEALEAIARRAAELVAEQAHPTDDRWLRGADKIAAYIDAKPDRVYALSSAKRIPVHRDGSALIARRSELDALGPERRGEAAVTVTRCPGVAPVACVRTTRELQVRRQ